MADTVANDESLIKLIKSLPHGFQEEADAMSEEELRSCIVSSSHNLEVAVTELKETEDYKKMKESWKEMNEPIRDVKKSQKAKIQYSLHRLEQLGKI